MPTLAIDKGFPSDLVKLERLVAKRVTGVFDAFDTATTHRTAPAENQQRAQRSTG